MAETDTEVVPSRVHRHARRGPFRLPGRQRADRRTPWWHRRPILVAGGAVLICGVALVVFRAAREGPLPNLELDGIPVGSLGEADLRATVERVAAERGSRRITITRAATAGAPDASVEAAAADTGYAVDVDATMEGILDRGRQWNPVAALVDHVRATFGAVAVETVGVFEQDRLDSWVRSGSARLSVPPREGSLEFEGTSITPVDPAPGAEVPERELAAAVRETTGERASRPVEVATRPVPPRTTPSDVQQVMADARRALSGPVRLRRGRETLKFTPEQIAPVLATEPVTEGSEVRLRLVGDAEGLTVRRKDLRRIETDAVDATFRVVDDSIRVVRSRKGFRFDPEAAADQLVVAALSEDRQARLEGERVEPDLTTEEARALHIREQVSTFTTHHSCCESRVTNIHRMADLLDGTVVLPGEVLSVNELVGERTEENGFVVAPAIQGGEFVEEVGGGISQFGTTMFNAIFFGGYDFLEYKAHSYYFDRYPVGREATVSWPSPDLEFRNDSAAGIFIDATYDDTSITVTFYGNIEFEVEAVTGEPYGYRDPPVECEQNKKLAKGEVEVVQEGDVGFDVLVERVFQYPDGRTETERFFTHYRAQPRIEERRSCD
jgi:vancomycin resistance protein YoaR